MSPTSLELGSKLALDRIFQTPTVEQIQGTTEPEQLERLPARLSKVKIPAWMLQRQPVGQPVTQPTTLQPQVGGRISRIKLPPEFQLKVAPRGITPEEPPAERITPPEEKPPVTEDVGIKLRTKEGMDYGDYVDLPQNWVGKEFRWDRSILGPDEDFERFRGSKGEDLIRIISTKPGIMEKWEQVGEAVIGAVSKPLFTVAGVGVSAGDIALLVALGFGVYEGAKSLPPLLKELKDKALQTGLNLGLDKWITRMSRGIPPQHLKSVQNGLYNFIAKDRIWLQQRATENMLQRMGRGINVTTATNQAVTATINDLEIRFGALVPLATQTGAMAFGGLPAPIISAATWNAMAISERVALVVSKGLPGTVASKSFEALTSSELTAIQKVTVTPVISEVTPPVVLPTPPPQGVVSPYAELAGEVGAPAVTEAPSKIWARLTVPKREQLAKNLGLREQIASKSWTKLSSEDKRAISEGLARVAKVAPPVVRPLVVDKLNQIIKALKPARAITEKLKSAELSKRVAQFSKALEAGTGREAFLSAMKSLKGKLPVGEFALPEDIQLSPTENIEVHEMIKASKFQPLTKLRISNSLDALLNEGKLPTEGEIPLLQEIFGEEFVRSFLDLRSGWAKGFDLFTEVLNMPRAFLTPIDWSLLYRQAAIPMLGEPEVFTAGAFKASLKGTFSEKMAIDMQNAIKANKYWPRLLESRFRLMPLPSEPSLPSWRAEPYVGAPLAEKIPGIGFLIKRSQMAFVSAYNKIGSDMFYRYAAESEGMEYPASWDRAMADMIQTSLGRGSLGSLNRAMPILNMGLFSTRLQAARITFPIKMLLPTEAGGWAPPARRLAIRQAVRAVLTVTALIALVKSAFPDEVEIEIDPRSTDSVWYGKIKIGNTRIDLGAGFGQYLRLITQLIVNERKLTTGEIIEADRLGTMERFIRSKLAPAASFVVDMLAGQTFIGEEMTLETEDVAKQIYNRFSPLFIQDMLDAINRDGIRGGFTATPGFVGVGIVTYPPYGLAKWEESIKDKLGKEFLETNRKQLQTDYAVAEKSWYEYSQLPAGRVRAAYRFDNPEIEASLFFWGEVAQITNPASWNDVNDLVSKYQLPPEVLPIRAPEKPWEAKGKTEEEIFGDLMNMLPKYLSDYVWANQEEWRTKDLNTLIPVIEKLKADDKVLLDRYTRITAGADTAFKIAYRKDHPDIDVALNFWGNVSAIKTAEARDLLRARADEYGIPYDTLPALQRKPSGGRTKIKLSEWP